MDFLKQNYEDLPISKIYIHTLLPRCTFTHKILIWDIISINKSMKINIIKYIFLLMYRSLLTYVTHVEF